MWIQCRCGNQIKDISEGVSYKAHYISDQDWFDVLDKINATIESSEPNKDNLCRELNRFLLGKTKDMYQCIECGRLFVDNNNRELKEFVPKEDVDTEIFRSR